MSSPLPAAVVFDFDGTIFDSETPIYLAYAAALADMGHTLTVPGWATVVGHGEDDSYRAMCAAVGAQFDRDELEARYEQQDRSWRDTLPALPGVELLLQELDAADVPCGIASSSPERWVEPHLVRLGLRHHFDVIATRDHVGGRSKPDPASYRYAVEQLGADPARSIAIEDSSPGITAALAAGLLAVAVPSEITRHTDLSAAHLTVSSMEALTLAALIELLP
ncbi:HAD family hydrolase [Aquihabitans sp. McL0605]|uniref:HAD family hydrolase n=1 Tax=Aquihabitans sp. McL0605 TaxID=3415671 RepID=UPI003CF4E7EE